MTPLDDVLKAIAGLTKQVADVRRRMNLIVVPGVAKEAKGQRVKLDLKAEGASETFDSPLVPIGRPSGKNGGGHSVYTKPGIGEPFFLISPGGEIGPQSRALHAGHVDDQPAPGTAENDSDVETVGNLKIEKNGSGFKITAGGTVFSFTAAGFSQTGGTQTHDGKNVGKDHTHTGVEPGGGNTGAPN